ncbi:MAG: TRAP transporter small permease subunit [Burkholderiales bacterium]|jgi:TRAP-type C4-dicarboxylate transport system permease small subunit|nr:TRAP transporter small permease subunit [Burkholderiales bacterium]
MRRWLDRLYNAAGVLAAFFMVATLAWVLVGIAGRTFHFYVRGTDAYAGYSMAAAGFLALAYTLRKGEHIRVTLLLQHSGRMTSRALEIWSHAVGVLITALLAFYSAKLAWQSYTFHDVSTGNDATPLWIPQISMALGTAVLFVAMTDEFIRLLLRRRLDGPREGAQEPLRME